MKKAKTKREAILTFKRRRRIADLVQFSGTCRELMSFEELMELRERDLPKADRLYST